MKLKMILVGIIIMLISLYSTNAQNCWIPNGISNVGWQSATVRVNITGNCWV